ncbi:hypothetical protein HGP16_19300 [Rhizobium sp. P40RR-XXII]|uniref:hypothetical protein n=1 Tax=Rhizobium sp. P40RR-XXII TaxID=2726739 RepID=UPI0014574661|nr:hypothetical protein [Rhizobium sp. P40RR-XXII]NLS18698.1 hypothetical protein [Rhizobium sp. P40RR-XXII]
MPLARPDHDSVGPQHHFSEQAKEILQRAAERAVQSSGEREVDTEHLLYELPQSEAVLKQFNISVDDLWGRIDANFPVGAQSEPPAG